MEAWEVISYEPCFCAGPVSSSEGALLQGMHEGGITRSAVSKLLRYRYATHTTAVCNHFSVIHVPDILCLSNYHLLENV